MTTTPNAESGATPAPATPATGTPASSGVTPAKQTPTIEEALAKIAELEHAHNNAREQADRQAKKLSAYEKQEEARKQAAMDDFEKAVARAEAAEKQIQTYKQELINARVREAAMTKGIVDPEMAALALSSKLEFGDDGMPTNLEKALDDLVKNKPYLLTQADSAAQTANQKQPPTTPANNPGRSQIVQPGTLEPGKTMRLADVFGRPGQ